MSELQIEPTLGLPSDAPRDAGETKDLHKAQYSERNDHWYLVQLKPGGFERAVVNLTRQGFASFMPMLEVTRKISGRFATRTHPLFAGYLFVRIPANRTDWRAINSTLGVARLVALQGAGSTGMPAALIAELRARCGVEGNIIPAMDCRPGAKVRVTTGPFAEQIATIDSVPEGERVWVLMEMMGQTVRTAVFPKVLSRI